MRAALELVAAAVGEVDPCDRDKVADDARHEDLVAGRVIGDARCRVHCDPGDVAVSPRFDLTHVKPEALRQSQHLRRTADREYCRDRRTRARERQEIAVAGVLDDSAPEPRDLADDPLGGVIEGVLPRAVPNTAQFRSRSHDVCEHDHRELLVRPGASAPPVTNST